MSSVHQISCVRAKFAPTSSSPRDQIFEHYGEGKGFVRQNRAQVSPFNLLEKADAQNDNKNWQSQP
jgi:hypothetical protein